MQRLGPVERTVLVLREAFGFEYDEIARIVGKSAVNCRQILHRARSRIAEAEARQGSTVYGDGHRYDQAHRLASEFAGCLADGEIDRAIALLSSDARLIADGGGKVRAARSPIESVPRIAAFILGVAAKLPKGAQFEMRIVNGLPGWIVTHQGSVIHMISLAIEGEHITGMFVVSNPEKLNHFQAYRGS